MSSSLHTAMLEKIHQDHLGITKSRESAKSSVWWPGISSDIRNVVTSCQHCKQRRPSQKSKPMIITKQSQRPFQKVSVDICLYRDYHYLVFVDHYSKFLEVTHLPRLISEVTNQKLMNIFSHHGIPI